MLFAQLVANFRGLDYKMYATISISRSDGGGNVDSWVFRRVNPVETCGGGGATITTTPASGLTITSTIAPTIAPLTTTSVPSIISTLMTARSSSVHSAFDMDKDLEQESSSKLCNNPCTLPPNDPSLLYQHYRTQRHPFVGVPSELVTPLRESIVRTWDFGTESEWDRSGAHEFKLKGSPWRGHSQENVPAHRVLLGVLSAMAVNGWNLVQVTDGGSLLFDKQQENQQQATGGAGGAGGAGAAGGAVGRLELSPFMFAISFREKDKIQVIGGVQYENVPVKPYSKAPYQNMFQLKLNRSPWNSVYGSAEAIQAQLLSAQLVANLRGLDYKLYTTVNISRGEGVGGLESWVFRRANLIESNGNSINDSDADLEVKM
ncbi:hypothetical protein BGX29_007100 [Mortierella sp. GBA35]|nr:hypothetical protein BGX29_007100 [Mortierella sp. GBA35]